MLRLVSRSLLAVLLLSSAVPHDARADDAQDRFVDGLDALAGGGFDRAVEAFGKAAAAGDEVAAYHLNLGVALMMSGKGPEANQEFARAARLEPRNSDVRVWSHVRLLMYEPMTMGGSPPYNATPYAKAAIEAAVHIGSPHNPQERAQGLESLRQVVRDYAWKQLGGAGAPAMIKRVRGLYEANQYPQCIALVDQLRAQGPLDVSILGYDAHCRLGLGDVQAARAEYTQALKLFPAIPSWLIGRARCEIAMGSLRDAEADFAISRQIDSKLTDAFYADAAKLIAEAKAKEVTEPPDALLASLKQAIAAGKPDEEVLALAERLLRARAAARYDNDEEFTRQYARLQLAVNGDAKNVDKLAALAEFLIHPTVVRKVALPGVDATARLPAGAQDLPRAAQVLAEAVKLDPKHPGVMKQQALLLAFQNRNNDAIEWVNAALAAGVADLDLCVLHLNYYTSIADQYANQAQALRTPKTWSETHDEGNRRVTTTYRRDPTAAELAQADELDRQSTALRVKAHAPLEALAGRLKGAADVRGKVTYNLCNAHHYQWIGKYDQSIAAAQAALKVDPYDVDALEFLIDLCPKVGLREQAVQCQDLLNNMINRSAGRTLERLWPQLRQTKFSGAAEAIEQAERVDPTSVDVAAARFALAENQNRLDDAVAAGRLVIALEEGRLRLGGRTLDGHATAPLAATEAALAAYVSVHLGQMLDGAGRANEAIAQYQRGSAVAARVPRAEWSVTQRSTALSTNERDNGTTLAALMLIAHRQCAYKLLAAHDYDAALHHCAGLVQLGERGQVAQDIGYQIYRARGWQALAGRVPDDWRPMFEMQDHQRANNAMFGRDSPSGDAELKSIDDRLVKIQREIQHGVGPDELQQLTAERDQLTAKRAAIVRQRQGH